ncbi:MAG: N-acetylmuramoyl-L-alanine amidase [Mangrovibacterium sp.]
METLARDVSEIIIHCAATRQGLDFRASDIDLWHRQKGWEGIGYHFVILLDGTIEQGRPMSKVGAHCYGHNEHSVGLCYVGGLDAEDNPMDTRTPAQQESLHRLLFCLGRCFPDATVHGHNEFSCKACPCFQVSEMLVAD